MNQKGSLIVHALSLWLLVTLSVSACYYGYYDPGEIRWNYPKNIEFVTGYFGDEEQREKWYLHQMELSHPYLFLAAPDLIVLDISDPGSPRQLAKHPLNWQSVDKMVIAGDYLVLTSQWHGLQIFDITDPAKPVKAGSIIHKNNGPTSALAIDHYVYFHAPYPTSDPETYFQTPRWYIIDIFNPDTPEIIREVNNLGKPIALVGNYLYAAFHGFDTQSQKISPMVQIIDISDRVNPVIIGELFLPGVYDIEVTGQVAYVSSGSGLIILDISDPTAPKVIRDDLYNIGSFPYLDSEDNILVGGNIYAVTIEPKEASINVQPLGKLDSRDLRGLLCSGEVSEAGQVSQRACGTGFRGKDIALHNGFIFVADEYAGLLVYKIPVNKE
jgi:hypothetical protein